VNEEDVITRLCAMIAAAELKRGREEQLKEKILKKFKITNKLFDAIMTEEKKEHEERKRKNRKPHNENMDIVRVGCIPRKVTTLDELNGVFGYIDVPGKANAFASCRDLKVIKKTSAMDRLANKVVFAGHDENGEPIYIPAFKFWFENAYRRVYHSIVFANEVSGPDVFNLFRGLGVVPKAGDCSLILAHIKAVLCAGNENTYKSMINLKAWPVAVLRRRGARLSLSTPLRGLSRLTISQ
jgi:hypothetical protein